MIKGYEARITVSGLSFRVERGEENPINARIWDGYKHRLEEIIDEYINYMQASTIDPIDKW